MKQLSEMTREELVECDLSELGMLAIDNNLEYISGLMPHEVRPSYISRLDKIRIELQDKAAK